MQSLRYFRVICFHAFFPTSLSRLCAYLLGAFSLNRVQSLCYKFYLTLEYVFGKYM